MLSKMFGFLGDSNDKQIKRYRSLVESVNALEGQMQALSDAELQSKTESFRTRLGNGESLSNLLSEAFATVREASVRVLGMRHFDVQLVGGAVLHDGKVAEMKTGEGKTLVATLPTYLNALSGEGVHVVTVNDYLARRDASWMGAIYHSLGLSVACLQHDTALLYAPGGTDGLQVDDGHMRTIPRTEAYAADITYGTNNEFGFDYLRDNMATSLDEKVQRPLRYAIVDEVDNILIDEARTPLIISGPAEDSTNMYSAIARVVPQLKATEHYYVEEKERQAILTESGISRLENLLKIDNLYDTANQALTHFVENGLRAHAIYKKDKDYVVKSGEVVIVDEFTGRLMEGRRYGEGLHQAIEAKERVPIQRETATYATITLQNYFRMYNKLAGMTGTAVTEAEEFYKVYKLDVVSVPTNQPMVREDLPDLVYKTEMAKFHAVVQHIDELHDSGRPVLVGTASIEHSERLSQMLARKGITHEVLNAKNHQREAEIVRGAGRLGAVTVSTNMAGRGTDIVLGGHPSDSDSEAEWNDRHSSVVGLGGLYVIGTERHESRRIDNQLRGRSGRQGDPGETRFYGSLEDEILTRFGQNMVGRLVGRAMPDDVPLESGMLSKTLEMTQGKVESYYFDIRKHLVEYDDVVNRQREVIYDERDKVLSGTDLRTNIQEMVGREISSAVRSSLSGDVSDWLVDMLLAEIGTIMPLPADLSTEWIVSEGALTTEDMLLSLAESEYAEREEQFGQEAFRSIERAITLQVIDRLWVNHLTMMSNIRQGIGLHAYGQRDPLVMYKKEGHEAFDTLLERIQHDVAHTIFHVYPAGIQHRSDLQAGMAGVDVSKMDTVMSSVVRRQPSKAGPSTTTLAPSASRRERRQASRGSGESKKARKRARQGNAE